MSIIVPNWKHSFISPIPVPVPDFPDSGFPGFPYAQVRNYAHLIKNAVKIFGSLARRYKTAKGKVLYAEKPRPFSFTYREKKIEISRTVRENMPLN